VAPLADDDEMTELVDADFPRVDLVGKGANGIPRFLIAKQDAGSTGLLEPEFVRDLIAKAEPEPSGRERVQTPSGITVSGSPADIAAFIHKASVRQAAEPDDVAKAKNDTADRKHKAATGAAMSDGSYPIASEADLDKAIHAVGRGGDSHNAIRKHVISRARSLGASSKIPDNWAADGSLKEASVSKTATVAKDADMGPELDAGIDGMDPTVPLAAPDGDAPGDPTDPGSPAWEAIDAATAQKWTSIAVRLKNALCVMSEREFLEAASADPDDAENAWDLQDAMCAVDFVISTLAVFAAGEQAEADLGGEAMEAIGKALGQFDPSALDVIEGLTGVAKSGRVLSTANETHIREAAARLTTVLSSLPQAPATDDGQPVAKQKEATVADTQTPAAVAKTDAVEQSDATGTAAPKDAEVAKSALTLVYDQGCSLVGVANAAEIVQQVAKADGEKTPMQAVFDQNGDLIGIVNPDSIQPVTGAGKPPAADADAADGDAAPAADPADMTPAPAAETGTPADAVADDGTVAKSSDNDVFAVLKSMIAETVTAALGTRTPAEGVAKQADVAGLLEEVKTLKSRLATVEEHPAAPKVFTNGQTPQPGQMRGQDKGAAPVDVTKALARKAELYSADAPEQTRIAKEMRDDAVGALAALHAGR